MVTDEGLGGAELVWDVVKREVPPEMVTAHGHLR